MGETTSMIVAHIERDWLASPDDVSRAGWEWTLEQMNSKLAWGEIDDTDLLNKKMQFRLRDEDNITHYTGWLLNDDECLIQECLSNWGARDTGGFIIEVRKDNTELWTMEIG